MSVVGIDLGCKNAIVAAISHGQVETVLNEASKRKTATYVSFQGKQRFMGDSAATMKRSNYKNTVYDLKRLIGREWDDASVQADIARMMNRDAYQRLDNGKIGIKVQYDEGSLVMTPEDLTAMLLTQLKKTAEKNYGGRKVGDVVVSVPGFLTDVQRRAMIDAGKIAGLNVLGLINENTASALSYGIYKSAKNVFDVKEKHIVMFVDVGYASFSVSVVAFIQGRLQVLASAYDPDLGGRDLDWAIMNHFADEFQAKHKCDPRTNPKGLIKLLDACEKAKKTLTPHGVTVADVKCEFLMNEIDFSGKLTVETFMELCAPFIARLDAPLLEALEKAKIDSSDLHAVEIIGGSSRVRCFKKHISDVLKLDQSKPNFGLSTTLNADECVARGCALNCAMLSPAFRVKEFVVSDVVQYPVRLKWEQPASVSTPPPKATEDGMEGMEVEDAEGSTDAAGNSILILDRGDECPKTRRVTFRRTEAFEVTAQYDEAALKALHQGAKPLIAKFSISGIPPNAEQVDNPKIRVNFRIDHNGIFQVSSSQYMKEVKLPPPAPEPVPAAPAPAEEAAPAAAAAEAAVEGGEAPPPAAEADAAPAAAEEKEEKEGAAAEDGAAAEGAPAPMEGEEAAPPAAAAPAAEEKEAKEEAAAPPAEEDDTPTAPPPPKKKKYERINLTVTAESVGGLTSAEIANALQREAEFARKDALIAETENSRNDLETYLYGMRDKMDSSRQLRDYFSEDESATLKGALDAAESWLYENFDDASKAQWVEKLGSLEELAASAVFRKAEEVARPVATKELTSSLESMLRIANSTEERYAHLEDAERDTVRKECNEARAWLDEQLAAQGALASSVDPVLTSALIRDRTAAAGGACKPIVEKPKPLPPPPPEPVKEEEVEAKAEPAVDEAEAKEGDEAKEAPMEEEQTRVEFGDVEDAEMKEAAVDAPAAEAAPPPAEEKAEGDATMDVD